MSEIEKYDSRSHIIVKGAKVNNLKNLDVAIPRNKLIVVTGVSGSGKSSLAFDTLFAEGQRMYVESLSSYARQFLGRMEKPEVEYIKGICPAIAVEQKVNTKNPRSTVGTTTEVYDYLKLLYARIGDTLSPISGLSVKKDSVTDVVNYLLSFEEGTRFMISCPLHIKEERTPAEELNLLLQKGFARVIIQDEMLQIEDVLKNKLKKNVKISILIDRDVVKYNDEDKQYRMADSVQTAFFEGLGDCDITVFPSDKPVTHQSFSDRFEADGILFEEPSINLFSFNNPYGACRKCEGFGSVLGIDPDLVVPDKSVSVYEGAVAPWRGPTMQVWLQNFLKHAYEFDFPVHRSYIELSEKEKALLWKGNKYFKGIDAFFEHLESKSHKIQYRVMLSRYRGRTTCPDCLGTRLRKDALYVKVAEKSIADIVLMPIEDAETFFRSIQLDEFQQKVAKRILVEICNRLHYLCQVGLGYLTLNRLTSTLSGGEYQRIKLATSLGSALVGSMYILDEPSIGLHPRDTARLIEVLRELQRIGNTVIVVEHEEEVMRSADQIIDIGPDAGIHGGELVFQGNINELKKSSSHTARYLNGEVQIEIPTERRKWKESITVRGASQNNLKHLDAEFPLGAMTVVTGVSGSGKSTLVRNILFPALSKMLEQHANETGKFDKLEGDIKSIHRIEMVDQNPIGKSSRSNPVTYVKAYDYIRQLFADQPLSKKRGYKPAHFSFNVDGGRCEMCQGEGKNKIEMQFMADIYLTCENCKGARFKQEILEVTYQEKNINDILSLSIDEAIVFFSAQKKILDKLKPLQETGLGYIQLGQSSNTLSGGEAQRVKLAFFLVKGNVKEGEKILFVFDEPTTGLHFQDIHKLLLSLNALVEKGHSVIIIEHNMEVIKSADWVIDLGPEGGEKGGNLCFAGTPEDMIKLKDNYTALYLKEKLK